MVTKQVFPGAVGGSISVIASSKFVKGSNPQWKKVLIIFFQHFHFCVEEFKSTRLSGLTANFSSMKRFQLKKDWKN